MDKNNRLVCKNLSITQIPGFDDSIWEKADSVSLLETISGKSPQQTTFVSCFRSDVMQLMFFRFDCQDNQIISTFRNNNEPIYQQDVLECFLSEDENLKSYIEIEVSPYNIHFVGTISFKGNMRCLDMSSQIKGFKTYTKFDKSLQRLVSVWILPYESLKVLPRKGSSYRINFFRVDYQGTECELQAWQSTYVPNFHVPEVFGYLDFV